MGSAPTASVAAADAVPFALPALLDAAAAPALAQAMRAHVAQGHAVVLDGSAAERVSTPCLQVLLATALDAQSRGMAFRLQDPSPVLARAIADLGLASGFEQ